jgi:hypothetical protein
MRQEHQGTEQAGFFAMMREASDRANLTEEEAMELAVYEIAVYRAQQQAFSEGRQGRAVGHRLE